MMLLLKIILLTIIYLLIHEGLKRSGKWLSWSIYLIIPLILTPYWTRINQQVGFFPWVKAYTILLTMCWLTALRFTSLGRIRGARLGIIGLLIINITEAVLQDFHEGYFAHYLVMVSGILLIITLPHPCNAIEFGQTRYRELLYRGMSRVWIIEYTLWNWAFLFLNYPEIAGQQIAVLGAALIIGLLNPEKWLMARGHTLVANLILLPTFPDYLINYTDTSHWSNAFRENVVAVICFGILASYSFRFLYRRIKQRRDAMV